MTRYYYTYEVFIDDPSSSLNGCYYYGKRESNKLEGDKYYGSGKLIRNYIDKHGVTKLRKTILGIYENKDQLNEAEHKLIEEKRSLLGIRCLNMHEGGCGGHWVEYCSQEEYEDRCRRTREGFLKHTTPEQRSTNAKKAGLSKRNVSSERKEEWSQSYRRRHELMSPEEKTNIYSQVSSSLTDYYTHASQEELQERRRKNKETNQKTSKKWRDEFFEIFQRTPESFRSKGMMREALELFRHFQSTGVDLTALQTFYSNLESQPEKIITYTEERNNKLKKYQDEKRKKSAKYIYILDNQYFYGEYPTMRYIQQTYGYKLYAQKLEKIALDPFRYKDTYPHLINIERKENFIQ